MKRLLITVSLTVALCNAVFAGDIPSVGNPSPAPDGTTHQVASGPNDISGLPGEIPSVGLTEQFTNGLIAVVVGILNS